MKNKQSQRVTDTTLLLNLLIKIFLVTILVTKLSSCKKYLDKKSDTSLVVPTSIEDLQALLDYADVINYATPIYSEASSDDYFVADNLYNTLKSRIDGGAYTWQSQDYFFPNDWSGAYLPVYTTNVCLERVEKVKKTLQNEIQWDNVKGSALFLRSYYFLQLAWTFSKAYDASTEQSDMGIVLRSTSDFNIPSKRANLKETYDRIIGDTKEAVGLLPSLPQHVMRPSKASAYGLLARTYLSMRQYDSAVRYANLCLSLKSDLLDFNNPSDVNLNSGAPFKQFNKEIIFYTQMNTFLPIVSNFAAFVDSNVYKSFGTNDLRKKGYFTPSGGNFKFKIFYSAGGSMFSGIATDEMYLISAEAFARMGDKNAALTKLNTLLSKRLDKATFVPVDLASVTEVLNVILVERRKELIRRGLRWIDIKRMNKEGANITLKRIAAGQTYTLPPNDNRFALPLPKDIIDQTGLNQN